MKELSRIRLENTAQLGSLEDTMPVKRLDPAQIRRLRAQAQKRSHLGFSIIRMFAQFWNELNGSLGLLFQKPTRDCDRNGHTPKPAQGNIMRCRYCNMEIESLEQLMRA